MTRHARTESLFQTRSKPLGWIGKTAAVLCLMATFAAPLRAAPLPADDPLARQFAYCAGRLSAEAQHHEDRELYALKEAMQELLAALMSPGSEPAYEELRIAGHVAQSDLLAVSRFSFDPREADRAKSLAAENMRQCRGMLLGG